MAMPSSNTIKMALPSSNTTIKMALPSNNNQKMANLAKLEFLALDVSGDNYLSWVVDAELHLSANGLKDTIESGKTPNVEQNAKAIIFLRHHIHENLKSEYLTVKNPLTLGNNLKYRFDHQKIVHLPHARYDWLNISLQDFKSIGSAQLPKVHNTSFRKNGRGKGHRGGRDYGRNRGHGYFRGRFRNQYNSGHLNWQRDGYNNNSGHHKWQNEMPNKRKAPPEGDTRDICFRCGAHGHWTHTCRTPKHLVELYESFKKAEWTKDGNKLG
ncbi:uncharacterized protein LOC141703288 [Apium graveolens]|uniref:uncharacterized protein LOC141703288 n=1 Tax=Apium graveolens TaxID=4045 RepID=UPI003D7BD40B